ncbi:hypothetical protein SCLCIDRAFT_1212781 [Scleroderma citrinum Foug A]|uniref:Uncharacterized protein n=1 Tax=Scleroderma citrinum Foug A TaxID=1036808 RepID=A0A0C3AIJ2_9AGAM|nr:hypothetical protein SCLCIDRAFT_1212781 [Scleroderma citrinum Foug A]
MEERTKGQETLGLFLSVIPDQDPSSLSAGCCVCPEDTKMDNKALGPVAGHTRDGAAAMVNVEHDPRHGNASSWNNCKLGLCVIGAVLSRQPLARAYQQSGSAQAPRSTGGLSASPPKSLLSPPERGLYI